MNVAPNAQTIICKCWDMALKDAGNMICYNSISIHIYIDDYMTISYHLGIKGKWKFR